MKCPIDETNLQMTERQGIEIDYCPKCRGVWLDRGELDKIIEKSNPSVQKSNDDSYPDQKYYDKHGHGMKYRKKGLLGELFDF
jgi:Zn-finger nucleic acid-binding protein